MTPILTALGRQIMARALAGESINFTSMQIGSGDKQETNTAVALKAPILTVPFTKIAVSGGSATLTATFNNSDIETGFRVTEIGFFVTDPDNAEKEILYALALEDTKYADFIPDSKKRIFEMKYEAMIFVGDVENVTATIDSSLVYVSEKDFCDHKEDTDNPHNVTLEQLGGCRLYCDTYTGTGAYNCVIPCGFTPKAMLVTDGQTTVFVTSQMSVVNMNEKINQVRWESRSVSWFNPDATGVAGMNTSGTVYNFMIIG